MTTRATKLTTAPTKSSQPASVPLRERTTSSPSLRPLSVFQPLSSLPIPKAGASIPNSLRKSRVEDVSPPSGSGGSSNRTGASSGVKAVSRSEGRSQGPSDNGSATQGSSAQRSFSVQRNPVPNVLSANTRLPPAGETANTRKFSSMQRNGIPPRDRAITLQSSGSSFKPPSATRSASSPSISNHPTSSPTPSTLARFPSSSTSLLSASTSARTSPRSTPSLRSASSAPTLPPNRTLSPSNLSTSRSAQTSPSSTPSLHSPSSTSIPSPRNTGPSISRPRFSSITYSSNTRLKPLMLSPQADSQRKSVASDVSSGSFYSQASKDGSRNNNQQPNDMGTSIEDAASPLKTSAAKLPLTSRFMRKQVVSNKPSPAPSYISPTLSRSTSSTPVTATSSISSRPSTSTTPTTPSTSSSTSIKGSADKATLSKKSEQSISSPRSSQSAVPTPTGASFSKGLNIRSPKPSSTFEATPLSGSIPVVKRRPSLSSVKTVSTRPEAGKLGAPDSSRPTQDSAAIEGSNEGSATENVTSRFTSLSQPMPLKDGLASQPAQTGATPIQASSSFSSLLSVYTSVGPPTRATHKSTPSTNELSASSPSSEPTSESDSPSLRSTVAAPAPSSIFGLRMGSDRSRKDVKTRNPIPSFASSSQDDWFSSRTSSRPQSENFLEFDLDSKRHSRWMSASSSRRLSATFRTSTLQDEGGRFNDPEPGTSTLSPHHKEGASNGSMKPLAGPNETQEFNSGKASGPEYSDLVTPLPIPFSPGREGRHVDVATVAQLPNSGTTSTPIPAQDSNSVSLSQNSSQTESSTITCSPSEKNSALSGIRPLTSSFANVASGGIPMLSSARHEGKPQTTSSHLTKARETSPHPPHQQNPSHSLSSHHLYSPHDPSSSRNLSSPQRLPYDDMKRLLSKPASVSGYTSGGASDSEGHSSRNGQGSSVKRQTSLVPHSHPHSAPSSRRRAVSDDAMETSPPLNIPKVIRSASDAVVTQHTSNWVAPWETADAGSSSQPDISSSKGFGFLSRTPSLSKKKAEEMENEKGKDKEKRSRNVLRRKTSSSLRATSPTPTQPQILNTPRLASSPPPIPLSSSHHSSPISHTPSSSLMPPKPSRMTSPSPSRGASSRSSSRSGRSHSPLPPGTVSNNSAEDEAALTPAEEIMFAYKQQNQRQQVIEESFEEADKPQRKMSESEQKSREEKQKIKALRDLEIERGKQQMNMRRGDGKPQEVKTQHLPNSLQTPAQGIRKESRPEPSTKLPKPLIEPKREASTPSTPYYTVIGSSSGKVVPSEDLDDSDLHFSWSSSNIGHNLIAGLGYGLGINANRNDDQQGRREWVRSASVSVGKPTKDSSGIGKTLSRKMSAKWGSSAKGKEDTVSSVTASKGSADIDVRGRPSLQERRVPGKRSLVVSPSPGEDRITSNRLRLSLDRPLPIMKSIKALPKETITTLDESTGQDVYAAPPNSAPGSSSTSSPMSAGTSGGKSKLWNLMKRISTGGLKDRYHHDGSPSPASSPMPPPVPALPKGLAAMKTGGSDSFKSPTASSSPGEVSMNSPSSKSIRTQKSISTTGGNSRPRTTSTGARAVPPAPHSSASSTNGSASNRPSTTRSSSPNSSSFIPPRSSRSSMSSYGEQIPPLPSNAKHTASLQQHIMSPSELSKLQLEFEKERESSEPANWQIPSGKHSFSTIRSGSTPNPADAPSSRPRSRSTETSRRAKSSQDDWMIIRTPAEELPSFSLPIRPSQRRRESLTNDESTSPLIPEFSTAAPINTWVKKNGDNGKKPSPISTRPSTANTPHIPVRSPRRPGTANTYNPLPPLSTSPSSIAHSPRASPSSPQRKRPLTEQQKVEKWDDLLQRSAKAGGTLHLSGTGIDRLESDALLFSSIADH